LFEFQVAVYRSIKLQQVLQVELSSLKKLILK